MKRSVILCAALSALLLTACTADEYTDNFRPGAGITNADDIITEEPEEAEAPTETETSEVPAPYKENEEYDPDADNLFSQGLTVAVKDGKKGYIDKTGSWVIEPKFDNAHNFYAGNIAIVRIGEKYGCIDRTGNYLIEPEMDYLDYVWSDDRRMCVLTADSQGDTRCGIIDKATGKWLIEPEFEYLGRFEENGLARAWVTDENVDSKVGFVDESGSFAVHPTFDAAGDLSNGMIWIRINDRYGYIDETGTVVIEPRFLYADDFSDDGMAVVRGENNKYSFIDKSGNIIADTDCDYLDLRNGFAENGLALAGVGTLYEDMMYGFIDKTGEWVIEPKFPEAESFSKNGLAAAAVIDDSGHWIWGYIDAVGSFVIEPVFRSANSFDDTGLAVISTSEYDSDGKYISYYGVIDQSGNYVIEPKYKDILRDYITGKLDDRDLIRVTVERDTKRGHDKFGYFDRNGNLVIEAKYCGLSKFTSSGIASVRNDDDKIGFINRSGEMVIDFQFDDLNGFYDDGYCAVGIDGKYCIIDSYGNYITELIFDYIPGKWMPVFE